MGSIQIRTGFFDPSIVNPTAYCSLNERMRCRRAGEELSNVDCCPVESQIGYEREREDPRLAPIRRPRSISLCLCTLWPQKDQLFPRSFLFPFALHSLEYDSSVFLACHASHPRVSLRCAAIGLESTRSGGTRSVPRTRNTQRVAPDIVFVSSNGDLVTLITQFKRNSLCSRIRFGLISTPGLAIRINSQASQSSHLSHPIRVSFNVIHLPFVVPKEVARLFTERNGGACVRTT